MLVDHDVDLLLKIQGRVAIPRCPEGPFHSHTMLWGLPGIKIWTTQVRVAVQLRACYFAMLCCMHAMLKTAKQHNGSYIYREF